MSDAGKSSFAEAIQRYADEVVDEFPHDDLVTLAAVIEEDVGFHDEGADTDQAIAAELRRRAAAGVRKWPRLMN
jgi:D-serine deaminase-like pyridoxal phosphate-dependent protein